MIGSSGKCRLCCKSLKTPGDKFPARSRNKPRSLIDVASGSLPKSPVSLSPGDEVPHMFTRKPRLQLEKFAINGAKRLLQHNRHIAAPDVCGGTSAVGEGRHRIPGASVGQKTPTACGPPLLEDVAGSAALVCPGAAQPGRSRSLAGAALFPSGHDRHHAALHCRGGQCLHSAEATRGPQAGGPVVTQRTSTIMNIRHES